MNLILGIVLKGAVSALPYFAVACPSLPASPYIPLTEAPFRFVDTGTETVTKCLPEEHLTAEPHIEIRTSDTQKLTVFAWGPEGSGRFWELRVLAQQDGQPDRGVCLSTSTVGWRTLQGGIETPLPFSADADGDGALELVLWSSFSVGLHGTMLENALTAWVYELHDGQLLLDLPLSRLRAKEIAVAYRRDLTREGLALMRLRAEAADRLSAFYEDACGEPH